MNHDRRVLQAVLRQSLRFFAHKAFHTLVEDEPFDRNWHIDAICHLLECTANGEVRRACITVPPRYLKSHLVSVCFVAWMLGHRPSLRFMCVSYSQDLAVTFSNQTRALMEAGWYKELFPGTRLNPRKNTEVEFTTTRGGGRLATSVGGTVTGRGADFILIDDPMKPEEAYSESARTTSLRFFDRTLSSRLNNKRTGVMITVMQRLHVEDLVGHVLARGGWTHLNLPAIAEADEDIPIGANRVYHRKAGDLLHEKRESIKELDEMRLNLGTADFSAQYLQQPVPAGGAMFKMHWFKTYRDAPTRTRYAAYVQSWDTASKVGDLNDYTVCTTWLVADDQFYLVDVFRERLIAPELRRSVRELYERFRPEAVVIEDKGSGMSLIQDLQHEGRVPVIPWEPKGEKQMRAHWECATVEAGKVHLPESAPWLDEFCREVMQFPNGRHDDQVDSIVQFLAYVGSRDYGMPRCRSLDDD